MKETEEMPADKAGLRHIAIIMDGNGRWAARRALPRAVGHRQGVESVRATVRAMIELKIPYLTLYSFSSENWSRPRDEITELMGLLRRYIQRDLADLHKQGVRIRVIGSYDGVDQDIVTMIGEAELLTAENTGLNLTVAFNYGSRDEIVRAVRSIGERVEAGTLKAADISAEDIDVSLDTAGIPDPDLLIRTSGEMRLSNFLLWQCAYTEFVFVDCFWPDFGSEKLEEAITEYRSRDRRYGGLRKRTVV